MKLLLVSNTYPSSDISGVGTLVFELFREAARRSADLRVLTRAAGPEDGDSVLSTGGPKVLFPLFAVLGFLRTTRGWVPDVVHVHESDGVGLVLLVRLLRELGLTRGRCRVAATLQVSYAEERRAVRPLHCRGRTVSRPAFSERVFRSLRAPLHALLGRLTAHLADEVLAPSQVTAKELQRDYGVASVRVVPNGIRGSAPPKRDGDASGTLSVLFVGRLRTRKAVAVLLEALAILRARSVRLELVVAGAGELEDALRSRVGALGLQDRVCLAGAVPRSKLDEYYERAAVFCLPSTYEGLPLSILEAMAAGLPVVSTTVSGTPEAVEDGVTGILVPPEDADSLADALESLTDVERRQRMGAAGRRRFEDLFTIERVAELHFELFEELAGGFLRTPS